MTKLKLMKVEIGIIAKLPIFHAKSAVFYLMRQEKSPFVA